jgi:hypothetical protein
MERGSGRRLPMSETIVAVVAGALFLVGVFTGVLVMVAYAIHREDGNYLLTAETPSGRSARGIRLLTGLRIRNPKW